MMNNRPPEPCPVFSPCWCAVAGRNNNPHCKPSVPIDDSSFIFIAFIVAIVIRLAIDIKAIKIGRSNKK